MTKLAHLATLAPFLLLGDAHGGTQGSAKDVTNALDEQNTEPGVLQGTTLRIFSTTGDANQGVAVDESFVYPVTNRRITKMDKQSGELLLQWDGEDVFPEGHFDSGVVVGDKLFVAQANWPKWTMASTVEVFDTETLEHNRTFSFGIQVGSFTWLDYYNNSFWGGFASYDRYQSGAQHSYGKGYNVQVVRLNEAFHILERWQIPDSVRQTFGVMSNSGGSWGPDGYLYLTGHDLPQAYAMKLPQIGSVLHHAATVDVPDIAGQGIAWDRTATEPTLYGIYRPNKTVVATSMPWSNTVDAVAAVQVPAVIHGDPADFSR